MKPAIGTQVMITGISLDSPFEVFNGRTGIVAAHPEGKFNFVTVHLTYPVNSEDIDLAYGPRGTMGDFTMDANGDRVDFLAKHLADVPDLIDPEGEQARVFVSAVLSEIRGMARRSHREIWKIMRDMVTADRVRAELDPRITTKEDARAWVHFRVNTDRWGF